MRRAKIAIVDSGISPDVWFRNDLLGGVGFTIEDSILYMTDDYRDLGGHGTNCASVIKKYNSEAQFYIVKIFNDGLVCPSVVLLSALEHLKEVDIDYINLSLSVDSHKYRKEIELVLKELTEQGKKIISSVRNGEITSYPAESSFCVGVIGKMLFDKVMMTNPGNPGIQYIGDFTPEVVQSVKGEYSWFGGNSKAAAIVTGMLSSQGQEEYTRTYIEGTSVGESEIKKSISCIKDILEEHLHRKDIDISIELWNGKECRIKDINRFMRQVESRFGLSFLFDDINFYNFSTVGSFLNLIIRKTGGLHEDSSKNSRFM